MFKRAVAAIMVAIGLLGVCGGVVDAAPRLTYAEWQGYDERDVNGPGTYAFGYDVEDADQPQFRNEERHANGTVTGSYGYVTPDGNVHVVRYIADHLGYRATVETKKRGVLKPIKVDADEDISNALNTINGFYRVRNNLAYRFN